MEDVKQMAEQLISDSENEEEAFEVFIKAMTQIIEKYGKICGRGRRSVRQM